MLGRQGDVSYSDDQLKHIYKDMERLTIRSLNVRLCGGTEGEAREAKMVELHRIAALIYLNCAVQGSTHEEYRHKRMVREGFLLLNELGVCESAWPLFIIACEASEDTERLAILEIFRRTRQDRRRRSNHMIWIQRLVEAFWNQNDLDELQDIDYVTRMNAVISSAPLLPAFA